LAPSRSEYSEWVWRCAKAIGKRKLALPSGAVKDEWDCP
jgi:hypothetical protein